MLEALCGACGQVFIPADETDLTHLVRDDGQPCGGLGVITGEWVLTHRTSSPERCVEGHYQWCETHEASWPTGRYQCRGADALGIDPFQVEP